MRRSAASFARTRRRGAVARRTSVGRWAALAGFVGAVAAGPGCGHDAPAPPAASAAPSALAPVAEPDDLSVTLEIHDGAEAWSAIRSIAGDDVALVPAGVGGAVAFATGLPITTAELFSEHDPIVGAMVGPDLLHGPEGAIAFHLRGADRLLSLATEGQSAPFTTRRDPATNGDLLVRAGGREGPSLGVFGNHLVIGTSERALLELGPYVSRNLAAGASARAGVHVHVAPTLVALAEPFLRARAAKMGGGASLPLFSLAVDEALDRLGASSAVDVDLALKDDAVSVAIEMARKEGASAPVGSRGSTAALYRLPSALSLGVVAFQAPAKRAADARSLSTTIGGYLSGDDRAAFDASFDALTAARGDEVALGYDDGPLGAAFFGRVAVTDRDRAAKALGELVDLASKASVKDAFDAHGLRCSAKETVLERVGDVLRVELGAGKKGADANAARGLVKLFVRSSPDALVLGSGADAEAALHAMLDGPKLEADDRVGRLVAGLPKEAHVALFVDPARLARGPIAPRSVAVATLDDADAGARIDAALDANAIRALLDLVGLGSHPG